MRFPRQKTVESRKGYQDSGSPGENGWGDFAGAREQRVTLHEDLGHHATSLRSSTRQSLGAWIASTLFQTALFTASIGARATLPLPRAFSVPIEPERRLYWLV
jgi:hypothetical protein